jgi:disulfide bond formation protein DsbB
MAQARVGDDIFGEPLWLALTILLVAAATILGALGFEHLGGYQPCALCLQQRTPYYVGVPLAGATAAAAWLGGSRPVLAILFVLLGVTMLYGLGLAVYHSGVEWRFWEARLVRALGQRGQRGRHARPAGTTTAPSCTDAVWRFLGLSSPAGTRLCRRCWPAWHSTQRR